MAKMSVVGTMALDTIQTPKGKRERILGGSGVFAGIAAGLFCPKVGLVSVVGQDFPQEHQILLQNKGICTEGVYCAPGDTFHWEGYYEADMAQAFSVHTALNVLATFDPVVPASHLDAKVVFLANVDPVLQKNVIQQFLNASKHPLFILDSMNYWIQTQPDRVKEVIGLVDVVILNDQELRLLTGVSSVVEAMPQILAWGAKRLVVKKGEHGAIMTSGQTYFLCPAYPLSDVIDPTGAGDSFAGAFGGYLAQSDVLEESDYRQAVVAGVLTASFTVQGFGIDRLATLTSQEFDAQLDTFQKMVGVKIDY